MEREFDKFGRKNKRNLEIVTSITFWCVLISINKCGRTKWEWMIPILILVMLTQTVIFLGLKILVGIK